MTRWNLRQSKICPLRRKKNRKEKNPEEKNRKDAKKPKNRAAEAANAAEAADAVRKPKPSRRRKKCRKPPKKLLKRGSRNTYHFPNQGIPNRFLKSKIRVLSASSMTR